MKMNLKMKTSEKIVPPPNKIFAPPPSHLDSHTKNDVKPEMLSGVQTGNRIPHDRYNVRGIAHACSYIKDDIFMQRRLWQIFAYILKWGQKESSSNQKLI